MADDEQHNRYQSSAPVGSWEHIYPHSHHGTPAQEYSGFNFSPPMPMESTFNNHHMPQRPLPPQLQPLIMPQWPSMLNAQAHPTFQPMYPQPIQPIQPVTLGALQTPISAGSTRASPTPRKTLTDLDRKRMCQYAEEHPNAKQTEIGAIFGVERSTVSKVLRQKEKYLFQDDGSKSPIRRAKGRSPDIERALAVWAKNQERKSQQPLTDDVIREKARAFASTTTTPENHQVLSSSWIEKFKLKNNLLGARSRKGSLAPEDAELISANASASHTPSLSGTSPVSPQGIGSPSPVDLHSAKSRESLKNESPDDYLEFASRHGPVHSQSANSLNSAFTDTAPSSFSPGPLSPISPFFTTPDSGTAPGPFQPTPPLTARPILPAITGSNAQRPRSQTFPLLDQYMGGTASTEVSTPRYSNTSVLDSPMEEAPDPIPSIDETVRMPRLEDRSHTVIPSDTMRPPPLPAHVLAAETRRELTPSTSSSSLRGATTAEDALRALQVVHGFIEQQPGGFLDYQESVTVGKLMEKLKLQSRANSAA